MNELEIHQALQAYFCMQRKDAICQGEERTYVVMEIRETDDHVASCGCIIDPAVPSNIKNAVDAFKLSLARHIAIDLSRTLRETSSELTEKLTVARMAADQFGVQNLIDLVGESKSPEDFATKLKALAKEKNVVIREG